MATAYIVAATPSSPQPKRISNLKSARTEADLRAKLDRVDVEVRTVATNKLTYTAKGAPVQAEPAAAPAPLADPVTEFAAAAAESEAADDTPAAEDSQNEGAGTIDMSDFAAALESVVNGDEDDEDGAVAQVIADAEATSAAAAAITAELEAAAAQDDDTDDDAEGAEGGDDNEGHRGQAGCGCSVEAIIATGEHQKGCADAPKAKAQAKAVERDKPARKATARKGGGGRREAQGPSVADGWELLYDKPKQQAQVGRNAEGKYALICTVHKHAHPLTRLVQERGLRGGQRSVWCPQCTGK